MKRPSEYINKSPLWFSMAAKHYSVLVTAHPIKFKKNSSEFSKAHISVNEKSPNIVLINSEDSLLSLNLNSVQFEIGYKDLQEISKKLDFFPPKSLVRAKENSEEYFIIFHDAEICRDWIYALNKIRNMINSTKNQRLLSSIFDISAVVKRKWAEITVTFVTETENHSEVFVYNLKKKNTKRVLLEVIKSFDGDLDRLSFNLIDSYINDLILTNKALKIKLFYTVSMKFVNVKNMIDYQSSLKNIDREEYRNALIEEMEHIRQPLPKLFQLIYCQKLAICYETLEVIHHSDRNNRRQKRVSTLAGNFNTEENKLFRSERFNSYVRAKERVRVSGDSRLQ